MKFRMPGEVFTVFKRVLTGISLICGILFFLMGSACWAGLCDDPVALPLSVEANSATLNAPDLLSPASGEELLDLEPHLLVWSEIEGATGYNLDAERIEVFPFDPGTPHCHINVIVSSTSFELPVQTLSPGVYRWQVRALGDSEVGPLSLFRDFQMKTLCLMSADLDWTLPVTVPTLAVPELYTPAHLENTFVDEEILLSWSAVPDATGYNFNVYTIGCGINRVVTEPNFQIPAGILSEQGYRWSVRALGGGGIGPKASERTFNVFEERFTPTPTVTPTPTPNIDFSGDGVIDSNDTFLILRDWYVPNSQYNLVADNRMTQEDLLAYLFAWQSRSVVPPTPLLHPPVLVEPENGAQVHREQILASGQAKTTSTAVSEGVLFKWLPVAAADGYQMLFNGPAGGTLGEYLYPQVLTGTEEVVTLPISLLTADLGTYSWCVRCVSSALEAQQQYGPFSDPFYFDVINPTPTPSPTIGAPLSADLTQDGSITPGDLFLFATAWMVVDSSPEYLEIADLDEDGEVEADDLLRFVSSRSRRREEAVPSPVLLQPAQGSAFTYYQVGGSGDFQWTFQAVPGAVLYRYQVIGPAPSFYLEGDLIDTGKSEYSLVSDAGHRPFYIGTWTWSIQAVAASGRVSPRSPWRSFEVVGGSAKPDGEELGVEMILPSQTPNPE